MDETKDSLIREIETEIENLSLLEDGSEEKARAIDGLTKLYKLKIEEAKNDIDSEARKEDEIVQTKDRYIRYGISAAEIILPIMFYSTWMKRGFKFEETGTFTSSTFRGLTKFFKPTRR